MRWIRTKRYGATRALANLINKWSVVIAPGPITVKTIGVLYSDVTQEASAAAVETTIASVVISGNVLAENGDSLKARVSGTLAATAANNKRIRVKFGGTTIIDVTVPGNASALSWTADIEIIRSGASAQKCLVTFKAGLESAVALNAIKYTLGAEDLTTSLNLVVTGEATDNNDIVKEMIKVVWEQNQ